MDKWLLKPVVLNILKQNDFLRNHASLSTDYVNYNVLTTWKSSNFIYHQYQFSKLRKTPLDSKKIIEVKRKCHEKEKCDQEQIDEKSFQCLEILLRGIKLDKILLFLFQDCF